MDTETLLTSAANLIPERYRWPVWFTLAIVPLLGRAWHALANGGGLRGVWRAIMFGTNTPKPDVPPVDKRQIPLLVIAGGLLAIVLTAGGCHTPPRDILSATTSTVGIDISTDPQTQVPHVRLGYVRMQYHLVPTGATNAPAVSSSMSLDSAPLRNRINENFSTGDATGYSVDAAEVQK